MTSSMLRTRWPPAIFAVATATAVAPAAATGLGLVADVAVPDRMRPDHPGGTQNRLTICRGRPAAPGSPPGVCHNGCREDVRRAVRRVAGEGGDRRPRLRHRRGPAPRCALHR